MGKYEPPYTISNKMLELVSSISEKVGKISSHRELETRPHLRKNNRIRSIHSSLKIEANSLSLSEERCHQWSSCIGRSKGNTRGEKCICCI